MKYSGDLYAKIGDKYVKMAQTAEDVDRMQEEMTAQSERIRELEGALGAIIEAGRTNENSRVQWIVEMARNGLDGVGVANRGQLQQVCEEIVSMIPGRPTVTEWMNITKMAEQALRKTEKEQA